MNVNHQRGVCGNENPETERPRRIATAQAEKPWPAREGSNTSTDRTPHLDGGKRCAGTSEAWRTGRASRIFSNETMISLPHGAAGMGKRKVKT